MLACCGRTGTGADARGFNRSEHDAYMRAAVPMLEEHPNVYRYVWFNSRLEPGGWFGDGNLFSHERDSHLNLTSTGVLYRDLPEGSGN